MQVPTEQMLSGAMKSISSTPSSLCSTILKSIASFFLKTSPAKVESSATSSESIVLVDVHTKLIPPFNTNRNTYNNNNNNKNHTLAPTPPPPILTPTQHQHITQHCTTTTTTTTTHSQSSLSLYFTTQPSSTFSFYSCSSCSSPFMPSACSSCSSCASTIAPLPFIVSPTAFNNSSARHFRPLCINVNADDSRVYRRLLVQLEETERRFDDFWNTHLIRLKQCLDLRRFEQDFRELQVISYSTNIWCIEEVFKTDFN